MIDRGSMDGVSDSRETGKGRSCADHRYYMAVAGLDRDTGFEHEMQGCMRVHGSTCLQRLDARSIAADPLNHGPPVFHKYEQQ